MESAGGVSAPPRRLQLRSRSGAFFGGRPALDHPARRLPRRYAGYRARRQWRGDRRRAGADDRLSDYRGGSRLAASRRRPGGGRPRTRIRFGERLRPGAGAGPYRPRSAAAWLLQRCRSRRPRRGGRRTRSVASHIAAKQEFAGYWEYLLDEAIFTHPAHPNWGGTGLISNRGELIGIGSLQLEREREGRAEHVNMIVPIDLLKPVLDDLRKFGRVNKPARPWLGMFTTEIDNRVVVIGISGKGPAARAELKTGDVILAVKGEKISSQTAFYRKLWALGSAGVDVPLTVFHEGVTFDVVLTSTDRGKLLKGPLLH